MKYLVKIGDLGHKIKYLEKQLDVIYNKVNYLETYKKSVVWVGSGAESFFANYNNYITELKNIEKETLSFIEFLTTYYNRYGEEYANLRSKYKDLLDEEV